MAVAFDGGHSGSGNLTINGRILQTTQNHQYFITAQAARSIASTSPRASSSPQPQTRTRSNNDDSSANPFGLLFGAALVMGVLAWIYLSQRSTITLAIMIVSAFTIAFTVSSIIAAAIRRVSLDWPLKIQIAFAILLACASIVALQLLTNPLGGSNPDGYERFLNQPAPALPQVWEMMFSGTEEATFVHAAVFQFMGVLTLGLLLVSILAYTSAVYNLIGITIRTARSADYQPSRIRTYLLGPLARPYVNLTAWVLLAGLAFFLLSGFAGELSSANQANLLSQVPMD